jgi:hypothetical protein
VYGAVRLMQGPRLAIEVEARVARGYEPMRKHSRWLLLKCPQNLTEKQAIHLAELVQYNLAPVLGGRVSRALV